jgi:type II secretory ATPase GspE/PulE/Tfp pilus assembly ATPase PilB-like protein
MTLKTEIPLEFWQRHRLLPLEDGPDLLTVGIHSGTPRQSLEDVRLILRKDVRPVLMSVEELEQGLRRLMVEGEHLGEAEQEEGAEVDVDVSQNLLADAADAPVVRQLNALFLQAMETRTSDIHFEPYEDHTAVRMRVDGTLHEVHRMPRTPRSWPA